MKHHIACTAALTMIVVPLAASRMDAQAAVPDTPAGRGGTSKIAAWDRPLRGANYVAYQGHAAEDLASARGYGIRVLRLFLPAVDSVWPEDADYFASGEYARRLETLDDVIRLAAANDVRVIVAGGTVPGRMYNWNEHGRGDRRLWRAERRHVAFAAFWRRTAERYRENPAVIGYELLNEPHFEQSREPERWSHAFLTEFADEVRGTPGDLNVLYRRAVSAIREVDRETPIVLDAGAWASPAAFFYLEPIPGDDRIIYSFHWYEPQSYTVWRNHRGSTSYPGVVTEEEMGDGRMSRVTWDIQAHRDLMAQPMLAWQRAHGVPSNRILCGEFSADRRAAGASSWNRDVITVLNENGWHWTYYTFRERGWNAKDFELGRAPDADLRSYTPMMRVFTETMRRR